MDRSLEPPIYPNEDWISSQTPLVWILTFAYVVLVKICPHRLPTIKHGLLPSWYYTMGIFQLVLLVAFLPEMISLFTEGWSGTVCLRGSLFTSSWTGTVVRLFVLSKAVDLVETLLIILEGRNPLDIHVFHHVVTLLYVWHSYTQQSAMARWFVFSNLASHVMLYAYLSPKKFGLRPCWLMVVTSQLGSLVICLLATFTAQRILQYGGSCDVENWRLSLDKLVIAVFITIFADFYHQKLRKYRNRQEMTVDQLRSSRRPVRLLVQTRGKRRDIRTGVNAASYD